MEYLSSMVTLSLIQCGQLGGEKGRILAFAERTNGTHFGDGQCVLASAVKTLPFDVLNFETRFGIISEVDFIFQLCSKRIMRNADISLATQIIYVYGGSNEKNFIHCHDYLLVMLMFKD